MSQFVGSRVGIFTIFGLGSVSGRFSGRFSGRYFKRVGFRVGSRVGFWVGFGSEIIKNHSKTSKFGHFLNLSFFTWVGYRVGLGSVTGSVPDPRPGSVSGRFSGRSQPSGRFRVGFGSVFCRFWVGSPFWCHFNAHSLFFLIKYYKNRPRPTRNRPENGPKNPPNRL